MQIKAVTSACREGLATHTPGRQTAVFLDRDGVINSIEGFVNSPEDMDRQLLPEAVRALARLSRESDAKIILVTNQGGVGTGRMTDGQCRDILQRLGQRVEEAGGRFDALYYCPSPSRLKGSEQVDARKPEAGMLLQAAHDFGPSIDLADSYMIGDMTTDIAAGENALRDLTSILVETGFAGRDGKVVAHPDHVARDLEAAVDWILAREKARPA